MKVSAHLRTALIGAIAMFLLGAARFWPMLRYGTALVFEHGNVFVELGVGALAGACGGLLLSVSHPLLSRGGVVGEYVAGWIAAFVTLGALYYFKPFVSDSFFSSSRISYGNLIVPSLLFGSIATFDVRRRVRRHNEAFPGMEANSSTVRAWLSRRPLSHQIGIGILAVLVVPGSFRLYFALQPNRLTYEEAEVVGREWAASRPNDPWAQHYHATTLLYLRKWEEALPYAERALELESGHPGTHEVVGWAHLGLGHEPEALEHLTDAAELDMKNARLWRDVGRVAYMMGWRSDALAAYTHVSTIAPNPAVWDREDRDAWNDLRGDVR